MYQLARLGITAAFFIEAVTALPASISWSPAQNTADKSDMIEGIPLIAWNGGSNPVTVSQAGPSSNLTYTLGPVNFTSFDFVGTGNDAGETPGNRTTQNVYSGGLTTTGDSNFDTLIASFTDAESGIVTGDLTLKNLTSNDSYHVQIFFNDQRNTTSDRVMTFGDGEGNTIDIGASATPGAQSDDYGQFATGTFIADSTNQVISLAANGFGNVHLNGLLVVSTNITPPVPPTSLVLTAKAGRIELTWGDSPFPGFTHYNVYRSISPGTNYTRVSTTPSNMYNDFSVNTNEIYYYRLTSENVLGDESIPSDEVSGTPLPAGARPNFLFIITDDQDTYSIGAYRQTEPVEPGGFAVQTPNIDRLANEGMLFHQARLMGANVGAVCTPSRTSIMTGKNTWERTAGVSAATTLPGVFNRNGYATYRTCKNGNSYPTANNEFTVVNDATKRGNTDGNGSEWHADRIIENISSWDAGGRTKPFLMYFGFSHPHDARNARPELLDRYGCVNTSDPANIVLNPNAPPLPVNALLGEPDNYPTHPFDHGHLNVRDEVNVAGFLNYRTEPVIRNEIGRNFACVDWIDQQIGRVLARLEDPNGDGSTSDSVIDDTYIVFTSDHGIAIGRHGLQGKQNLYEHTWKVPYIVRGPGISPNSESDALIYLHDTFPTFCDLADIAPPDTIDANDGQSFREVLEGDSETFREYVYGLYAGGDKPGMRAVTDGRFKLIKYDVAANATQETQLFDLETNPFELLPEHGIPNLANHPAYALIRQELEEQLMQMRKDLGDPYALLGDRLLYRFEEGTNGLPSSTIPDALPWGNNGTAMSGLGGSPIYTNEVFSSLDYVMGQTNILALDFERDQQHYIQTPDARELDFENQPFTIEAWVKLETYPASTNLFDSQPIVQKKLLSTGDSDLNYMFLAAAGSYGSTGQELMLHLGNNVILSSLEVPDTNWHHLSVAFDPVADLVRFTMDDQVDTKISTQTPIANNGPLIIGAHFNIVGNIDRAFDGLIDELSISSGFLPLESLQPLAVSAIPIAPPVIDSRSPFLTNLLRFSSQPTQLYDIWFSNDIQNPDWQPIRTFIGGASSTNETTIITADTHDSRGYYQLRTTGPRRP